MAASRSSDRAVRGPFLPLVAVLSFAAVALALVSQHVYQMQPCAWCTLQRLIYLLVGVLAAVAWLRLRGGGRATRLNVLALIAAALSLYGVAVALYQHLVAARSQSCALTLADKVIKGAHLDEVAPWLFKATAYCSEANVPLLGVPYAIWSALLFALLTFLALRAAWRPARRF
jgi:protein dithiol:quinone oxidoreductase